MLEVNKIMNEFWDNNLSKEDLEKNKTVTIEDIREGIETSIQNEDSITLENSLFLAYTLKLFGNADLYLLLLKKGWHREHEDIVKLFQIIFNNSSENVKQLSEALRYIPDYLNIDENRYEYIRKVLYALGAQPQPYNLQVLESIMNETNDPKVKELITHQLEKRKELGRWEVTKND